MTTDIRELYSSLKVEYDTLKRSVITLRRQNRNLSEQLSNLELQVRAMRNKTDAEIDDKVHIRTDTGKQYVTMKKYNKVKEDMDMFIKLYHEEKEKNKI